MTPEDKGWNENWCGHKKRDGSYCKSWKTKRVDGSRRDKCYAHGSLNRPQIYHTNRGRYSGVLRAELSAKLHAQIQAINTLDLSEELALIRAYLCQAIEKWREEEFSIEETNWIFKAVEQVSRLTETIVRMRNQTALTAAEVHLVQVGLAEIMKRYVPAKDLGNAVEDLFRITSGSDGTRTKMDHYDRVVGGVVVSDPEWESVEEFVRKKRASN